MKFMISQTEFLDELLKTGKKPTDEQIIGFYQNYQYKEDVLFPFSKFEQDIFHVDLESLSDKELVVLHQHTKWIAPSYVLRKRYMFQIESIDDDILLCLVQTRCESAKQEWMNRYRCNMKQASDELLILFYKEGSEQALNILTKRHEKFVKGLIRQLRQRGRFFRGMDDNDVFQESMFGYLKAVKDYKIERKMKFTVFTRFVIEKYLDTIINQSKNTKNASLNDSYSFHAPIRSDAEMTFEESFESERTLPDELAVVKDTLYKVWGMLTALEKDVIIFHAYGHTYEEIGEMIKKDKKAVDNTLQRVRTKGERYREMYEK